MSRNHQIHLYVDEELKAFLKEKAKESNLTLANYCRQKLTQCRRKEEVMLKEILVSVDRIYRIVSKPSP